MHLIVGLGNPGKKYEYTRHNVGFDVIDLISSKYDIPMNKENFKGIYGIGKVQEHKVFLLKPTTYMNLSGESIRKVVDFYKIPKEKIIVIYDDISLEPGRIRIRAKGSSGGHNGIKSIITNLNSDIFSRIKIGVGKPVNNMVCHVLGKLNEEERRKVQEVFKVSVDAVNVIIDEGIMEAMNRYNNFKA